LAIAICVLWVRSYWSLDLVTRVSSNSMQTTFGSQMGVVYVAHFDAFRAYRGTSNPYASHGWKYKTHAPYAIKLPFTWERDADSFLINAPHWSIACVAVVISVLTAIPWRFGRFVPRQFSLRSMLVATTLVAVVLGLAMRAER
jgi:hypothetical protein